MTPSRSRHRHPAGIVKVAHGVHESGPQSGAEASGEFVGIHAVGGDGDWADVGVGDREHLQGSGIRGLVDDDDRTRVQQRLRNQCQRLL